MDRELWAATHPTVFEFADDIANDLYTLAGDTATEEDFTQFDTDASLFVPLCGEWEAENR